MQSESLGRYRITEELGRGAMGRVYLAHDPQIDRLVAIKTIQIFESLPDKDRVEARERFEREARSAGKLLHPGIVTLFDVGEHEGIPFLAMEYVEGSPLDAHCSGDDLLPVETVVEMIAGVAEALHYAHDSQIVHRDIKPGNLMWIGGTTVKIMDFGLAKSPASNLTSDGTLLGTPSYMSPEQIRGGAVDGRSDLFSLACVLYEMLTGTKPFGGDSISSIVYRIVHEEPEDPAELSDRVPALLANFLNTALSKDPGVRFPDGASFAQALRAASAGDAAGVDATAAAAAETARMNLGGPLDDVVEAGETLEAEAETEVRPARRSGTWFWVGVIMFVAIVAAGAWYYKFHVAGTDAATATDAGAGDTAAPPPAPLPGGPWEARVRTEPEGLEVTYNDTPLEGGRVRFPDRAPFGVLSARVDCRVATHELSPMDVGGEIVLVTDPVQVNLVADPGIEGARVILNGTDAGKTPASLNLDLCEDNILQVQAEGYRPGRVQIAAGATTLEARTALAGLSLEAIPRGTLRFPSTSLAVTYYVDGKRVRGRPNSMELYEGHHELRVVSEKHWIDITAPAKVAGGQTVRPLASLPPLAELRVLAFPPNCKAYLRRGGKDWRFLADTPANEQVAAGRYQLRVELIPTGDIREQDLELQSGTNPPVRVSFGGSR